MHTSKKLKEQEIKQKQLKRMIYIFIAISIICTIAIVTGYEQPDNSFTYDQMLHDHDGDGIPDH